MRKLLWVGLLLAVSLLTGCMKYSEQIELQLDGSGRFTFTTGISDTFDLEEDLVFEDEDEFDSDDSWDSEDEDIDLDMDIDMDYEDDTDFSQMDGITLVSSREYEEDGFKLSEMVLGFDSLQHLSEAFNYEDEQQVGEISFTRQADNTYLYRREICLMDEEQTDPEEIEMMKQFFGDLEWEYSLRLPGRILEANAKPENIDSVNNTVKWSFTVGELTEGSLLMWAKIKP